MEPPRAIAGHVPPPAHARHVVQLYDDEAAAMASVASWLRPALAAEAGAIVIATPERTRAVLDRLDEQGLPTPSLLGEGRLLLVDAAGLLARFRFERRMDPSAFARLVRSLVESVRHVCAPSADVRAWGEMVDLLYGAGEPDAARELEELWNEAIAAHRIRLLCTYRVRDPRDVARLKHGHDHVIGG